MKADSGYTDEYYRNEEAAIIRADEATLPASASVLYIGDFNLDGSALVTKSGSPLRLRLPDDDRVGAGAGRRSAERPAEQQHHLERQLRIRRRSSPRRTSKLQYRDDLELMTQNVYGGTGSSLDYVAGSVHAFGNNGSVGLDGTVDSVSNTALAGLGGERADFGVHAPLRRFDHRQRPFAGGGRLSMSPGFPSQAPWRSCWPAPPACPWRGRNETRQSNAKSDFMEVENMRGRYRIARVRCGLIAAALGCLAVVLPPTAALPQPTITGTAVPGRGDSDVVVHHVGHCRHRELGEQQPKHRQFRLYWELAAAIRRRP